MESKKTEKADLQNKGGLIFNIGLVLSLLIVITAFEWKSGGDGSLVDLGSVSDDFEEMIEVPPTDIPPPPPPKIQQPEIVEVPDEEEIEDEIKVEFDVEITEDTKIEELVISDAPEEEDYDQVFLVVEESAAPKGGLAAFYDYVQKKMKYPAQARRMGIEGKVFVEFVVNKDGTI
ncbi:MAG TPA: TonB family protein, partial [Cyclobacteriaceae bacterium]|nr:TonB family protein [Cyclobacteriaceae bacterium]